MTPRIYPIYLNGHEILYTDWRNLLDEGEFLKAIRETSDYVVAQGSAGQREIVDVRGSFFNLEIFQAIKTAALRTRPFNAKKCVVVDLSPSRMLMLKFLNAFASEKIEAFDSLEVAKEWVIA